MKAAISIEHPAWAHQFRHIIQEINRDGKTLVLAVDKDGDLKLLDSFGIRYAKLANSTGKNVLEKGFLFVKLCMSYYREIKRFDPDILIGRASPMMAVAAKLLGKPHVLFEDTEVSKFSLNLCRRFSSCIITPEHFLTDLGEKQLRMPIYKELFYLHEKEFSPDREILRKNGIDDTVPYIIIRFVAWNASHDAGINGISEKEKIAFVENVSRLCRVYISSEAALPPQLEPYKLKAAYEDIHHILYYATAVISEGASMASEAAVLGTHAFYLNEIASGTTEEQEEKYHLVRVLHDPATRYVATLFDLTEMMKDPELWKKGKEKRKKILEDMPDPNLVFLQKMEEAIGRREMEK